MKKKTNGKITHSKDKIDNEFLQMAQKLVSKLNVRSIKSRKW